jgi:hypothetical protein
MEHKLLAPVRLIKDITQAQVQLTRRHFMVVPLVAVLVVWAVMEQQVLVVLVVWALRQLFLAHLFFMLAVVVALHTAEEQLALAVTAVAVMAL